VFILGPIAILGTFASRWLSMPPDIAVRFEGGLPEVVKPSLTTQSMDLNRPNVGMTIENVAKVGTSKPNTRVRFPFTRSNVFNELSGQVRIESMGPGKTAASGCRRSLRSLNPKMRFGDHRAGGSPWTDRGSE
jgi:hypothetical protein